MSLANHVSRLGVLAEPTRAALYSYVVEQTEPISREQAAQALDLAVHSVKFHLDKLVDAGLLEVEYRRIGERTGRGAGRPSKLYRRSAIEVQVSVPPRQYDVLGSVMAAAVERAQQGEPLESALREVAHGRGRAAASSSAEASTQAAPLERLERVLGGLGYEPQQSDDEELVLGNCPFDRLAREHTDLVCGLNLDFVEGVIEGLDCAGVSARLQPSLHTCCVRARDDRARDDRARD